ncbi:DUF2815 family protein [Candidatus Dependentiae bacterium]|nr:MAG: DUF2815 family protein [Candidatus Dependentiae bacterium]
MTDDTKKRERVKLNGVRISFPSLTKRENFEGKEGKYAATFLIPKENVKLKKKLDRMIQEAIAESGLKIKRSNICLKDGDESDYEGYPDNWSIKASNKNRPKVYDRNRDEVDLEDIDDLIQPGYYVNAVIDFWIQDNKFGKKVNANLLGVQFFKKGEILGNAAPDVSDDFEGYEDDEDEDDDI